MKLFSSKYAYLFTLILATTIIAINFKKPMGFFRESNSALVCINTNVWLQNDNIKDKHIPVTTYSFDKKALPIKQSYATCTTFGYGWFAVPYYFFSITHLQVTAINMRLFSLCWLVFTLLSIYLLAKSLINFYGYNKKNLISTICFYILSPTVLWYNVQGYVHEIAVLPFYFLAWLSFVHYLNNGNRLKSLLLAAILILVGVQFDWLPCMQAFVMSLYLLIKRKELKQQWAFFIPTTAIIAGLLYIFYTYINWMGATDYISHLQTKFLNRTIGSGNFKIVPFINHNFNIIIFYFISFGLTALLFITGLIKLKFKNPIIWMMIATAALHHLIFWGFSSEHDHAVIKMAFPIVFVTALFIKSLKKTNQHVLIIIALLINIGLYFSLHNYNFRKGIYTNPNFCYNIGNSIKQISQEPDEYVFMDTENKYFSQIELYAGKAYIMATSIEEAKAFLLKNNLNKKACFIRLQEGSIVDVTHF